MSRDARRPAPKGVGGPVRPARSELRSRQQLQSPAASQLNEQNRERSGRLKTSALTQRGQGDMLELNSDPSYAEDLTDDERYRSRDLQKPPDVSSVVAAFQSGATRRGERYQGTMEKQREKNRNEGGTSRSQVRQTPRANIQRKPSKPGDVDAVLDQIEEGWAFISQSEFNPVDLALSLLDDSSIGQSMQSFRRTKEMLEVALRGTIDKHFQSFAAALPHHASTESSLTKVQQELKDARNLLHETRDTLGAKRSDLVQLWSRGQALEEMVRLIDEIESIKSVPDVLETLISEKRWLQASTLLMRSLKITAKVELLEIGALSDLRSYLMAQEGALKDMLIEELQAHIYLKVFWTDNRWAPYTINQQTLPVLESDSDAHAPMSHLPDASLPPPRLTRFLSELSNRLDNIQPCEVMENLDISKFWNQAVEQSSAALTGVAVSTEKPPTSDPESDTFTYIEMLIESLGVLGKLTGGLDAVIQRLPNEINAIIQNTGDEVAERSQYGVQHELHVPKAQLRSWGPISKTSVSFSPDVHGLRAASLRLTALESASRGNDSEVLKDFFWTLYSKLDAVLQALRVVYEVSRIVISRRESREGKTENTDIGFPMTDLWLPMYAQMRSLLKEYLAAEEAGTGAGRNPLTSIADVLRESRYSRDRNKPPFRLIDNDGKMAPKMLKRHEDELSRVLNDFVPGLVSNHMLDNGMQGILMSLGADDRFPGISAHKLLVKSNPFHVTVLFQPTLAFIERACQVIPDSSVESATAAATFLDEFVLEIYLPQLRDKVLSLFQQGISRPDAFEDEPLSLRFSPKPVAKASIYLVALVNSLCSLQKGTPFHRENYALLVLDVIIRFYQGCYHQFLDLVTPATRDSHMESGLSISARLAQKKDVMICLSKIFNATEIEKNPLYQEESELLISSVADVRIQRRDLVSSTKNFSALGLLYHTLSWLVTYLRGLRVVSNEPIISPVDQVLSPLHQARGATLHRVALVQSQDLELLLSNATASQFDALVQTYEQMAELVLYTMRLDIRCRAIHFLDLSVKEGNYLLDNDTGEPDAHIVDLNVELATCEDAVINILPEKQRRFIFEGIGLFMEQTLISNSRHLRFINLLGIEKMRRNILALQQNLKTLAEFTDDRDLAKAKRYYELFMLTPQTMLDGIQRQPIFSADEYTSMLRLQCGVDPLLDKNEKKVEFENLKLELNALLTKRRMETSS
ncbi:hypothetical protein FRC02_008131 [Tulasnella sp. 418]|nr:hypothetical protein FRC02_008131 [Tulasnella sp. 418]